MNKISRAVNREIILFYLITVFISWPIIFVTDALLVPRYSQTGFAELIALFGHILAMLCPMLSGLLVLRYFQKDKLLSWIWSRGKYYIYALFAGLLLWVVPGLIWLSLDKNLSLKLIFNNYDIMFVSFYLVLGWIAGIGEEYGWSAFVLTELYEKIGKSKAVVVSGCLRGFWHLPFLAIPVYLKVLSGNKSINELFLLTIVFAVQLIIGNIFFSALFGYVWFRTKSIPLLGWMHFLFDAFRDFTIFFIAGFINSTWFKIGWAFPFYFLAYLAFTKIAKEDGYSNYLEIFYKKKY